MKQFISGATIILVATLILTACGGRNYELNLVPAKGKIYRELKTTAPEKDKALKIDHFRKFYPDYTTNNANSIKPSSLELGVMKALDLRFNQDLDPKERAQLLEANEKKLTKKGVLHTWSGFFKNNMPGEFGGFGRFHSISNNMGSASLYIERYSGSDDIAGQLQESWKAIDILVEHMVSWLDTQFMQEKGYPKLREFLNKNFRQDLKNFRLYLFQYQATDLLENSFGLELSEIAKKELVARFSLYLVERGYFKITDLPKILQFFEYSEEEAMEEMAINALKHFLAKKMGLTDKDPLPEFLEFLENQENFENLSELFLGHFEKTEYYKNQLKKIQKKNHQIQEIIDKAAEEDDVLAQAIKSINKIDQTGLLSIETNLDRLLSERNLPQLIETNPGDIYEQLSELAGGQSLGQIFWNTSDSIALNIKKMPEPLLSNGTQYKWDKEEFTYSNIWKGRLDNNDSANISGLPAFSYAVWAQPNKIFQEKHFGEVTIEGENLLQYCLWHASLSKAEAKEWDEFTTKLKPSSFDKQFEEANFSEGLSERVVQLNEGVFDAFGD